MGPAPYFVANEYIGTGLAMVIFSRIQQLVLFHNKDAVADGEARIS